MLEPRDAETLARALSREQGYGMTAEDIAELSDADILRLTDLDGDRPQRELDNERPAATGGPLSFRHVS